MADYKTIYAFNFRSAAGWVYYISISKLNYTGQTYTRRLGRAPLLRRDNNGSVYGTSLEIYAECQLPGEYAQLYTSSPYEYKVVVIRNGSVLWTGFLTPELFSEPDRPVPYDVRIVATDGLGELKRERFVSQGIGTLRSHLERLLGSTGIDRSIALTSALSYDTGTSMALGASLFNLEVDLSHEEGNTYYDVLQHLLSAFHAGITVQNNVWYIFREADFIGLAEDNAVPVYLNASATEWPVATFGSARSCKWWPIGNLDIAAEPAKKGVRLTAPYSYLDDMVISWSMVNGARYDSVEDAYVLTAKNDALSYGIGFGLNPVAYKLTLRFRARNVGQGETVQRLGVRILINGEAPAGNRQYWLSRSTTERGEGRLNWATADASIMEELREPTALDTEEDAQEIEIILPLYEKDSRTYMRAQSLSMQIYNVDGAYPIQIYDLSLSKLHQPGGQILDLELDNNAREASKEVDLHLSDGASIPKGGIWSMSGIPIIDGAPVKSWRISGMQSTSNYLDVMGYDYARTLGLPRLRYTGKLNVPYGEPLPCLFRRDGTYYWPKVYVYDLYNDEMDVDMMSVPAADINSTVTTTIE